MTVARRTLLAAAMLLGAVIASHTIAARGGRSGAQSGGHSAHPGAHGGRPAGRGHYVPRFRPGVFIGAPLLYYYPAPIMAPTAPTYIEQYPGQSAPDQSSYWFYCASLNGYYPYVSDCPEGWQPVAPQPHS